MMIKLPLRLMRAQQTACRGSRTAPGEDGRSTERMKRFYPDVLGTGERLGVEMPYPGSLKEKIRSVG
jgi:hypothetical protein